MIESTCKESIILAQIIIIGGGVAGMAAGIRALNDGSSAVIVERHRAAGGNLTGWDREGYHIDNCIHWLTGTNPVTDLYRVWEELGVLGGVPIRQGESLYTYTCDKGSISLYRDIDRLAASLYAQSRGDEYEISQLIRAVRAARTVCGISAYDNTKAATAAEKARYAPRLLRYLPMTTGGLAERFRSPVIRGFLRGLLSGSFGALALLIVFATYCSDNGGIPAGASCGMARRMEERFRSLGGTMLCGSPAARIGLEGSRAVSVMLADGRRLAADYVVLACDPACAFGALLDEQYQPNKLCRRERDPRLSRFSSFHCAFACEGCGLPFSGDLVFDMPDELRYAFGTEYIALREFSHERSFAPDGKSLIQALCFCTREHSERLIELSGHRAAYREEKRRLTDLIARAIGDRVPRLTGRLRCIDSWSPATYRRYTGAPSGAYLGYILPSGRVPTMLPPRVRGLDNVFLATQLQQDPGGLPTAASAGIAAAEAIRRAEAKLRRPLPQRAYALSARDGAGRMKTTPG